MKPTKKLSEAFRSVFCFLLAEMKKKKIKAKLDAIDVDFEDTVLPFARNEIDLSFNQVCTILDALGMDVGLGFEGSGRIMDVSGFQKAG